MKIEDLSSATKLFQRVKKCDLLMRARGLFFIIDFFLCLFMRNPERAQTQKKKILIPCFSGMGDAVLFFRLSNKIKALFPENSYELVWLCNDAHTELFKQFFNHVLPLPLYKMSFNLFARFQILRTLHREYYDMVLDPSGCCDFTPNIFITRSIVSPVKIGLCPGILDCGRREKHYPEWLRKHVYTKVITVDESFRHLLNILESFFETAADRPIPADIAEPVFAQQEVSGLPEKYYVICPAGSHERQIWPIERYPDLISRLYEQYKIPAVLVGTVSDQTLCCKIHKSIKNEKTVINLANKTNFKELTWILAHAEFVVTIDTGTFHLSNAVKTETFVIAHRALFHLYIKYSPLPSNIHIIVAEEQPCIDCAHLCTEEGNGAYPCVANITVNAVIGKTKNLLINGKNK